MFYQFNKTRYISFTVTLRQKYTTYKMSSKLVERKVPKNTRNIEFRFKNYEMGVLNLCCWKEELRQIENANRIVLKCKKINIYFPYFDYFYVKSYSSQSGFTFATLIDRIAKAGIQAGKYYIKYDNPEVRVRVAEDFIVQYSIVDTIEVRGCNVYVEISS